MSVGGSRAPWWLPAAIVAVLVFAPGFVITVVDAAAASLEKYGDRLPDATEPVDEWQAPCDTDAVLDALGMTAAEYQASRGLYVDGVIGPQTATALCAEELPAPEGSS